MKKILAIFPIVFCLLSCSVSNTMHHSGQIYTNNKLSDNEILRIIGDEKVLNRIENIVRNYNAELIGTGFDSTTYKTHATLYFPKGKPSEAIISQINRDLSKEVGIDMETKVLPSRPSF